MGTPVISSTRGALEEVVTDAAIIVDPENIPEITRALTALSTDPDLAESLKVKGLANAARFHWSRTAAEVTDIYRKAAGNWQVCGHARGQWESAETRVESSFHGRTVAFSRC